MAVKGVRTKERVRDLGEVFTAAREVNNILDLTRDHSDNIHSRFLEPAAGNGNFLAIILERRLAIIIQKHRPQVDFEFAVLTALSNIYGVDIDESNVREARARMRSAIINSYSEHLNTKKPNPGFYDSVDYILDSNILVGDMLKGRDTIEFTEYSSPKVYQFKQRKFRLIELELGIRKPFATGSLRHYLEISRDPQP